MGLYGVSEMDFAVLTLLFWLYGPWLLKSVGSEVSEGLYFLSVSWSSVFMVSFVMRLGLGVQLNLEDVVKLNLTKERPQERSTFFNINKSFSEHIVVVPELWHIFLKVSFSFSSMESEMRIDYFSGD